MPCDTIAEVSENRSHGGGYFALEIVVPAISSISSPGQFLMIGHPRWPRRLNKPLSIGGIGSAKDGTPCLLLLYQVVGEGTARLSEMRRGEKLKVIGPLGRGFSLPAGPSVLSLLVGGGIGIPPLLFLAREMREKSLPFHLFYGARTSSGLFAKSYFEELGSGISCATEDGSVGERGLITDLLERRLDEGRQGEIRIYSCGPTAMLAVVQRLASRYGLAHEVSVEEYMACGFGVCMGCSVPVAVKDEVRYKRVCKEGPVFKGSELAWRE